MSAQDRRHAAGVARRFDSSCPGSTPDWGVAAALMHDVGKIDSRLGTFGRVLATLATAIVGHDRATGWSRHRGFTRRVGLYLRHAELGSALLAGAHSDPRVQAWAGEHHSPEARWTLPLDVARALKAADDD